MIRTLAMLGMLLATLAVSLLPAVASADGEQKPTTLTALDLEPGEEPGTVILSARLNLSEQGYPLGSRTVQFFIDTDFFGSRPLVLEGVTDGSGKASVLYTVNWEGEHRFTASFAGDGAYLPAKSEPVAFDSDLAGVWSPEAIADSGVTSLSPLSDMAILVVGVVWLALLLILAVVVFRVVWTIRTAGPVSQPAVRPGTLVEPFRSAIEETSEPRG